MFRILSSFVSTRLWISLWRDWWNLVGVGKRSGELLHARKQVMLFIPENQMEIARTFTYFYAHTLYQGKVFYECESGRGFVPPCVLLASLELGMTQTPLA